MNADLIQTRPELQVKLDRQQSLRLGLPLGAIGQELRMAMTGARVSRMSLDGQPRDIQVRLLSDNRQNASDWTLIPIRTQSGQLTTMGAVGALAEGESPIEIKRLDKARMISVSMELSERSLGEVAADVEQMLSELDLPAGIQTQIAGAIKDQRESFGDMGLLMSMGLALVYLVMVAQFESWTAPFVIMFAVPFAATGAFLALLVSGTNLSVTSFLGLVILIGVVVNNAIVLIDYTQLLREKGQPLIDAVINAGQRRLRPVLITTLTTSGGMLPLALTTGEGEQLWGPMGKTALATNIGFNAAKSSKLDKNEAILIFSLEMSAEQLAQRILAEQS
ncbi:MAG: efflux RND transporter permease subunit, partial [Myxococcota bacterium]|nr:efflux RND transporter permease subunit [Myxococcota bacterium]